MEPALHILMFARFAIPQAQGSVRTIGKAAGLIISLAQMTTAQMEVALQRAFIVLAVLLLSCGVSFAQMAPLTPTSPAMGATSPLGVLGATSSVGPVGIPLGSSELTPGGLSPAPLDPTVSIDPCAGTGLSGTGTSGSASTFDGAGMSTNTMGSAMSSLGSCGAGGTASGTTAAASSLSGMNAGAAPGTA